MRRRAGGAALTLLLTGIILLLSACSGSSGSSGASSTAADYTAIIDVRTPGEYAQSHVEGAVNMDVQAATFAEQIGTLAKDGTYLVYCRSGNRSAVATQTMTAAGLTVTDGGGLSDMEKAGFAFTS